MRHGILFNEEDSRRIDGLLEYCELESVGDLLSKAIDTMYAVIEASEEYEARV
jgi:hypothetical protein